VTHSYDSKSQHGLDDGMPTRGHEITVVLLAYNCGHRIVPIVEHLVALQLPIVAVDNGSQDNTASALASFEQVELVRLPQNIGAAGRNTGVDRVHTPYVLFCDDDGWYEADGLPVVCDLFERHPNLALINAKILVGEEQRLDPISREMAESPVPDRHGLPGAVLLSFMAGAAAVRTVAYKEVGGLRPTLLHRRRGGDAVLQARQGLLPDALRSRPRHAPLPEPRERRQPPRLRDAQHVGERVAPPPAAQCPLLDGVHARGHAEERRLRSRVGADHARYLVDSSRAGADGIAA
jgi:hypothetical protein